MDKGLKHKHTILLVDDEVSITKSLQRVLRKEGYIVITACNGQEGLDILHNSKEVVSLIISDQRMPGMAGIQFLKKTIKILPNAVRFLLTGYTDIEVILDALNKGEIHQYLAKPWNDNDLLMEVHQGLQQYELLSEKRSLKGLVDKKTISSRRKQRIYGSESDY